MPFIETKIGKIYVIDQRKNTDTPPLLLIHGAGGTHLDWPASLRRLPNANPLLPDLPGHGKSPTPGRDTITAYAADIISLLDALEIPSAIVAGQSMGGAIALTLALDYSERVSGLILIGTGAKLSVSPDIVERILTDQEAVARLLSEWYWSEATPIERRELTYKQIMAQPAQIIYDDYVACNGFDVRARLNEIQARALIFAGTQDKMTPQKYGVYLQQYIPDAELVTLEGAGHMMALEQPDAVASAVGTWLNSPSFSQEKA